MLCNILSKLNSPVACQCFRLSRTNAVKTILGTHNYTSRVCIWASYAGERKLVQSRYNKPQQRTISQDNGSSDGNQPDLKEKKLSLIQRFKQAYAIYGKVVIAVHGIGSCFWFGSFYLAASSGISILELFEAAHFPQWMCNPLRMGGGAVNTWATALVLYKLAAPFRYGLTLFLTRYVVKYLRTSGRAPQLSEQDRLRNLARESAKLSGEHFRTRLKHSRKNLAKKVRRKDTSPKDLE